MLIKLSSAIYGHYAVGLAFLSFSTVTMRRGRRRWESNPRPCGCEPRLQPTRPQRRHDKNVIYVRNFNIRWKNERKGMNHRYLRIFSSENSIADNGSVKRARATRREGRGRIISKESDAFFLLSFFYFDSIPTLPSVFSFLLHYFTYSTPFNQLYVTCTRKCIYLQFSEREMRF